MNLKRLLPLLLLGLAPATWSDTLTVSWTLPGTYCSGAPIQPGDITDLEIYISESDIPSTGVPCGGPVDNPPQGPGVVVTPADPDLNQVDLDVAPGRTYFLRARVQAGGVWSNLSNQVSRFVPMPRPDVPTITIISI